MRPDPFKQYLSSLELNLSRSESGEHTHRAALEQLVESLKDGVDAINEPRRVEAGAPDFLVKRGLFTVGHIECKDVGKSLDEAEESEQLKRYRGGFHNLILTDYLEFRWYVNGERGPTARLGRAERGHIVADRGGAQDVCQLLTEFLSHPPVPIGRPRELALHMARRAHMIRQIILGVLRAERDNVGARHAVPLQDQLAAFRETLIPDLSEEDFADMYAQTIAYGLFAARCGHTSGDFSRRNAAELIPETNPFLRRLFNHIAGFELDSRVAPDVDYLADLLSKADMSAVLEDFGKGRGKEDPVVHFYETFLKEYDPKTREMRGVYYTPEPVVSYIVRSVDHLLKTRFNRPQGLADPSVLILDPACGTGTFLYYVINEIHEALVGKGQAGVWNAYVTQELLPRLFGFELLMAPYAVAHLKLAILLRELGHQFPAGQRLGIYLTNTLEEAIKRSELLFAHFIVEEANAAARIKSEEPIMVVLGNPPYSGHSANKGPWIRSLLRGKDDATGEATENYFELDGQPLVERNPKWLNDDYVKFIRFGQWRIERTGQGILAFITNHAYLDNPTFRGMRQSLMNTFTDIYILDLHGNAKKRERTPEGGKDENVFDIQQGVAIAIFVKEPGKSGPANVHHANLWGLREEKYRYLWEADVGVCDTPLQPRSPNYLLVPFDDRRLGEYQQGWKVTDIFPVNTVGVVTSRDALAIDFDEAELHRRVAAFRDPRLSDHEVEQDFHLKDTGDWALTEARRAVQADDGWQDAFTPLLYRPFDIRHVFYHDAVIERPRRDVMRHMLAGRNLALATVRNVEIGWFDHIFCCRQIMDHHAVSMKEVNFLFPLYLYPLAEALVGAYGHTPLPQDGRRPNLSPDFIKAFSDKLHLQFIPDSAVVGAVREPPLRFGPEDVFHYAYAIFHCPTYRARYAQFLRLDFPRLPLTSDRQLFKALAEKGEELVSLHLMESPKLEHFITTFPIPGSNILEKVRYECRGVSHTPTLNPASGCVYINADQYFAGIPPELWDFQIGGYQVLSKWLKDRKGRQLSYDDITHYQKIAVALSETLRLMAEIHSLIPSWPIG